MSTTTSPSPGCSAFPISSDGHGAPISTCGGNGRAVSVTRTSASPLLRHRLQGEVSWAGCPVAVEDAERRLLVGGWRVGQRGEVQVPDEHAGHPRIVRLHPLEGTHQVVRLVLRLVVVAVFVARLLVG